MEIRVQRVNSDPCEDAYEYIIWTGVYTAGVLSMHSYASEKEARKAAKRFVADVKASA